VRVKQGASKTSALVWLRIPAPKKALALLFAKALALLFALVLLRILALLAPKQRLLYSFSAAYKNTRRKRWQVLYAALQE
jgi:hypothetical protein